MSARHVLRDALRVRSWSCSPGSKAALYEVAIECALAELEHGGEGPRLDPAIERREIAITDGVHAGTRIILWRGVQGVCISQQRERGEPEIVFVPAAVVPIVLAELEQLGREADEQVGRKADE